MTDQFPAGVGSNPALAGSHSSIVPVSDVSFAREHLFLRSSRGFSVFRRRHCKTGGLPGVGRQRDGIEMFPRKGETIMDNKDMPITDKYSLSIKEAAQYFSIGIKKMRRLAEDNLGDFAVYSGNRYLIIRSKFEEYLQKTSSI